MSAAKLRTLTILTLTISTACMRSGFGTRTPSGADSDFNDFSFYGDARYASDAHLPGDETISLGDTLSGDITRGDASSPGDTAIGDSALRGDTFVPGDTGGDSSPRWYEFDGSSSGGGISNSTADAGEPAVALDSRGNPVVAWADNSSGVEQVYLRIWNGTDWIELDGSASGGGISQTISTQAEIEVVDVGANQGWIYVLWVEENEGATASDIYVKAWDGNSWIELDGSASGGGVSQTGTANKGVLVTDSRGYPHVVWEDGSTKDLYLRYWDGFAWQELNGSATSSGISNTGYAKDPLIALTADDYPVVAWRNDNGTISDIYLTAWDGGAWGELDNSASDAGISQTGTAKRPALALDTAGQPMLVWEEDPGLNNDIYGRFWDANAWTEFDNSASGGGISHSGVGKRPDLAVDSADQPIVVWQDGAENFEEIYLLRWDGFQWTEIMGSASNGGISNTPNASSSKPQIAVDGIICVTWIEEVETIKQVYVRCFQ